MFPRQGMLVMSAVAVVGQGVCCAGRGGKAGEGQGRGRQCAAMNPEMCRKGWG